MPPTRTQPALPEDPTDLAQLLTVESDMTDAMSACARGVRAVSLGSDRFRRHVAEELEVTVTGLTTLGWLEHGGDLTPSRIAKLVGVGMPAVTSMISGLEKLHYVRRVANPNDRRSTLVSLTPAGRHAIGWVYEQLAKRVEEALVGISEDDCELTGRITLAVGLRLLTYDRSTGR